MEIEQKIFVIRGQKVMLDSDLAELYGVATGNLNKAVSRNLERFPSDFMFQLSPTEYRALRFQIGILKRGEHSKYLPLAFTEQGVAMLSSVLRSRHAVQVNIAIMRAFVKLRRALSAHKQLAAQLERLERRVGNHDDEIQRIFEAIKNLMTSAEPGASRPIGFKT